MPSGASRNITSGENRLSLLPIVRWCVVDKVLSGLERREQYRQAVMTVERGVMASLPCERCPNPRAEHTFQGCFFTDVFAKCAECLRHSGSCVGATSKFTCKFPIVFS